MLKKRVVITGYSLVTPLGLDIEKTWQNVKNKKNNFKRIKDLENINKNQYPQELYISVLEDSETFEKFSHRFVNTRSSQFARKAFADCLSSAKISKSYISGNSHKFGISFGSLSSNLSFIFESMLKSSQNDYKTPDRFSMINVLNNAIQNTLAEEYQIRGPMLTPATACASSLSAIGDAFNLIQLGYCNTVIAGASEEMLNPFLFNSVNRIGAMAKNKDNLEQGKICCPFDSKRHGIVLGEGAGFLVLEDKEIADKRKADYFAEIVGYGMSCDGFNLIKPDPEGKSSFLAMEIAIERSDMRKSITAQNLILNAHATSTIQGDIAEINAYLKLRDFLECGENSEISINAFKGNFGHTFSSCGTLETILGLESLKQELVLPLSNFDHSDINGIDKFNLNTECLQMKKEFMLKNSFGFGGVNNSILFHKIK